MGYGWLSAKEHIHTWSMVALFFTSYVEIHSHSIHVYDRSRHARQKPLCSGIPKRIREVMVIFSYSRKSPPIEIVPLKIVRVSNRFSVKIDTWLTNTVFNVTPVYANFRFVTRCDVPGTVFVSAYLDMLTLHGLYIFKEQKS
jgi:hypothetical protein